MTTLDQILDVVMELPDEQQKMLLDIIQRRRLETRRKEIAKVARESLTAFHAGELKPQPIEGIIEKLRLDLPQKYTYLMHQLSYVQAGKYFSRDKLNE